MQWRSEQSPLLLFSMPGVAVRVLKDRSSAAITRSVAVKCCLYGTVIHDGMDSKSSLLRLYRFLSISVKTSKCKYENIAGKSVKKKQVPGPNYFKNLDDISRTCITSGELIGFMNILQTSQFHRLLFHSLTQASFQSSSTCQLKILQLWTKKAFRKRQMISTLRHV